jgi:hypothetical protein
MAQVWLNIGKIWADVPMYSGIFEQNYFFKSKKNLWHSWHRLKLSYYRWYTSLIGVPRVLAQPGTVVYSARATLFVFLKTFLPKNLTIHYKGYYETS